MGAPVAQCPMTQENFQLYNKDPVHNVIVFILILLVISALAFAGYKAYKSS
jgi:hypothetical protein